MQKVAAPELFITRRGKKISRKTFWYNLKKYARLSGVEKNVKPHMLRHSFATHLLRNGANLMLIREMLGHSDLSTTQIYTNLANDDIRREYEKSIRAQRWTSSPTFSGRLTGKAAEFLQHFRLRRAKTTVS